MLRKGVRCLEIDMWDGDDGQPIGIVKLLVQNFTTRWQLLRRQRISDYVFFSSQELPPIKGIGWVSNAPPVGQFMH